MPKGVYERKPTPEGSKGEKHWRWKGDRAGYWAMHKWIVKQFGSPRKCEHCNRTDKKRYHWANVDHKYLREKKYWMRLCQSCHIKWDIANNNRVNNYR